MGTPRRLATALPAAGLPLSGPTRRALGPAPARAGEAAVQQASAIPLSPGIRINGAVRRPTVLRPDDLRRFPVTTQTVHFNTRHGPILATVTGVLLWTLLRDAGIRPVPDAPNGILRRSIELFATDGYRVVLGAGEVDPIFGNELAIVAYEENGGPLTEGGFARLIMPGDKAGGRNITSITRVEVR